MQRVLVLAALLALVFAVGLTPTTLAAPSNDAFSHAAVISSPPFTGHSDTTSATVQSEEPKPSCSDRLKRSVWWRFTAAGAAHLLAFDDDFQVLAAYRGTQLGSLTRLGCDDQGGNVTFNVKAGDTIYLQVGTDFAGDGRPVTLHLKTQTAPSNDAFSHAAVISSLPFTGHSDTTSATVQSEEPKPSCSDRLKRSVWWRFTAAGAAHLLAFDDDFQVLAAYRGTQLGSLTRLGCDDQGGNVTFNVKAGDTIYLQVGTDFAGDGRPVTLHLKTQTAPSNDAFSHAAVISSLPFTGHSDTTSATVQSEEPKPSCSDRLKRSVWWRFTAAGAAHLLAFDDDFQVLAAYRGTQLGSLTRLGCDDQGGNVTFNVKAGDTIYLQVGTDFAGDGRPVTLHLKTQTAPSNDAFSHAAVISSLPFTGHSDTTSATVQSEEPKPSCSDRLKRSVWWRFTAAGAAHLLAFDDDFQVLAAYRGTQLGSLTRLGCDDQGGNVTFNVTAGDTIYLQVGTDFAGDGRPVTLHLKSQ